MKKVIRFLYCFHNKIEKKFFNFSENDNCHNYKEALNFVAEADSEKDNLKKEEYLKTYNATTRWQTV